MEEENHITSNLLTHTYILCLKTEVNITTMYMQLKANSFLRSSVHNCFLLAFQKWHGQVKNIRHPCSQSATAITLDLYCRSN